MLLPTLIALTVPAAGQATPGAEALDAIVESATSLDTDSLEASLDALAEHPDPHENPAIIEFGTRTWGRSRSRRRAFESTDEGRDLQMFARMMVRISNLESMEQPIEPVSSRRGGRSTCSRRPREPVDVGNEEPASSDVFPQRDEG